MTEVINMPDASAIALEIKSANFETRKVQHVDIETVRITPTVGSRAFSLLFVILGLAIFALYVASQYTSFEGPASIPLLLVGVLFFATGVGVYYDGNEQVVISRHAGVVFIRSWHPSASLESVSFAKHVQPKDITAVQSVSRVVKRRSNRNSRRANYTQYQVNLCSADSERHNLFITLKSKKADDLAKQLAQMFDVPLWAS